jgi:hypothetical protein
MEINKTKKYTILIPSEETVDKFLIQLKNKYPELKKEHLIVDFSEKINTKIEEINLFLKVSTSHRENGLSFVIICEGIDIDEIPDEIVVVPTLTEAKDVLEMDAIERELGF